MSWATATPIFPKNWDELYDQLYEIRDKGVDQPLLPHWINEWYGISWGFDFEVMNRGGQVAHPDTHEPLLTTDMDGPAYKTLEDWKRIWNDGLVSEEVLTYNESSYIDAYASGRYVFSPQQLYDLETFNREDRLADRRPRQPPALPGSELGPAGFRRLSHDEPGAQATPRPTT